MSTEPNTLFLRLAGPMQSWGTSSRLQLRRTDLFPSKSAILGLLLCAQGIPRQDSMKRLERLNALSVGVRIDRPGTADWDYHTVGAKIGIRSADGKTKRTASTGEFETQLSRRQYLYDASFLAVLHGDEREIRVCADALSRPVWPIYLGRKCCLPAEPVFAGVGYFETVKLALASVPWHARAIDRERTNRSNRDLDIFIEHRAGSPPPTEAKLVYDVPRAFGFYSYGARYITPEHVTVPVERWRPVHVNNPHYRKVDYKSIQWQEARRRRLEFDRFLCVFCKSAAQEVHHVTYERVGHETNDDLRSLCKTCHDACTMLEYGRDLRWRRIDPSDASQRETILDQINRNIRGRRRERRRELLRDSRDVILNYFDNPPAS